MTILKYLKDRWLLLIGWLFFLFLTCFILWLAPNVRLDWTVVGYIFLLQSVFLSLFLTNVSGGFRWQRKKSRLLYKNI